MTNKYLGPFFAVAMVAPIFAAESATSAASQEVLCSAALLPTEIFRNTYCDALSEMHEPKTPLDGHADSSEVYRFLWFRSFAPSVIARIDVLRDGTGTLTLHSDRTITSLRGLDLVISDTPVNSTRLLNRKQVTVFRRLVAVENFWKLPSQFHLDMGFGSLGTPIPEGQGIVVSDGARWVIEGQSKTRYHLIGDEGSLPGPVWNIGLAMLHLAQDKNPSWLMGPVY